MVIKSKIYDFLKKNLGEYLYGFEKNQLDVGLLSGHIELVNVNFRPDKVNELLGSYGLPVHIKAGLIGKLRFKCHYTSFLSSPMEVELDELLLVFGPISHIYKQKNLDLENDEEALLWQMQKEQEIYNYAKGKHRNYAISDIPYTSDLDNPWRNKEKAEEELNESRANLKEKRKNSTNLEQPENHGNKKSRSRKKHEENHEEDAENGNREGKHSNSRKHKKHSDSQAEQGIEVAKSSHKSRHRSKAEELNPSDFKTNEFNFESNHHSRRNTSENQDTSYHEEPKKKGLLEKYFTKVLKNLTLTIKTVHITFEDETYPYEHPLSIGFSLEKLEVKNVSNEWYIQNGKQTKRQGKKNSTIKEIVFTSFAFYIYSMASVVIPTSLYEATIDSEIGIFEAFPAYEVRELIIQQSEMLSKDHTSTFIEPTNGKVCVTFHDEAPNIKAIGHVEKVICKFTPAMAECMRNFFDYCTNVQIWPFIARYKPSSRIPERPAKREHRKERKKRKEIVLSWFQYAFEFVKIKRAAIKYLRERKKEREFIKKMEAQEKNREKIMQMKIKESQEKLTFQAAPPESARPASLFSMNKQRKPPGSSGIRLDEIVKDYNLKKQSPLPPKVRVKRPYDGEKYFPKNMENSELEFHLGKFRLSVIDEDTGISVEFHAHSFFCSATTLVDEMQGIFMINDYLIEICDQSKKIEFARCTAGKGGKDLPGSETGFKTKFSYRPGEIFIPGDVYACLNKYDVAFNIAPVKVAYTHNIINHLFLLKEALSLDKSFRENLNVKFIKSFAKHCKKRKMPKVFGMELKKFVLAKKVASSLVEFQKQLEEKIVEINPMVSSMLFNFEMNLEGGSVDLHDFSPSAVLTVSLPVSKFAIGKNKESTFLSLLGINVQSESSPAGVYDFLLTLGNILTEKLKKIKVLTEFRRIS